MHVNRSPWCKGILGSWFLKCVAPPGPAGFIGRIQVSLLGLGVRVCAPFFLSPIAPNQAQCSVRPIVRRNTILICIKRALRVTGILRPDRSGNGPECHKVLQGFNSKG